MVRLVFMGSDAIALPALRWLTGEGAQLVRIVGVFTQPDRAVGRGMKVQANAIKLWALAQKLPVWQPEKIGMEEQQQLVGLQPDVTLIMAYGHILKAGVIATPRLGTLNLHTSILPAYRGASPIQTAIAAGEKRTGVTLMRLVPRLDAGPIAGAEQVAIDALDTGTEVERKLAQACVPLLARCLPGIANGTLPFSEQDDTRATFCRRLDKSDGVLDFNSSAAELAARINGLMPWPGCTAEISGLKVKLGLADVDGAELMKSTATGTVLGSDYSGLLVSTSRGVLRIRQMQRPGGKMLPTNDFLRGFPVAKGTRLASFPMPRLAVDRPFPRNPV